MADFLEKIVTFSNQTQSKNPNIASEYKWEVSIITGPAVSILIDTLLCRYFPSLPFTRKQRIYLLERYLATKSYADTIAAFTAEYEDAQVPNKSSISQFVKKFCEMGRVMNAPKNQTRTVLTPEKVEEIGASFSDTLHSSIRKVAKRTGTSIKFTHLTTQLLKLYPYCVSVLHEVNPADCPKRFEFCK